jgi:hypothetical protein
MGEHFEEVFDSVNEIEHNIIIDDNSDEDKRDVIDEFDKNMAKLRSYPDQSVNKSEDLSINIKETQVVELHDYVYRGIAAVDKLVYAVFRSRSTGKVIDYDKVCEEYIKRKKRLDVEMNKILPDRILFLLSKRNLSVAPMEILEIIREIHECDIYRDIDRRSVVEHSEELIKRDKEKNKTAASKLIDIMIEARRKREESSENLVEEVDDEIKKKEPDKSSQQKSSIDSAFNKLTSESNFD